MKEISKHDELSYKAMQLTILTASRTNEVLGATWDELAAVMIAAVNLACRGIITAPQAPLGSY